MHGSGNAFDLCNQPSLDFVRWGTPTIEHKWVADEIDQQRECLVQIGDRYDTFALAEATWRTGGNRTPLPHGWKGLAIC